MAFVAEARTRHYQQELEVSPLVVGGVRRVVRTHLRLWGFASLADAAALCVHELLVNVPRHTGSPKAQLVLDRGLDRLRVTVSDTSPTLPVKREPDWIKETGRGLVLLDEMTDAWGAVPNSRGKDVWFEMRAKPGKEAA